MVMSQTSVIPVTDTQPAMHDNGNLIGAARRVTISIEAIATRQTHWRKLFDNLRNSSRRCSDPNRRGESQIRSKAKNLTAKLLINKYFSCKSFKPKDFAGISP